MLEEQRFEPFYTKRDGDELKIVLAYEYFTIIKDDEIFFSFQSKQNTSQLI